MVDNLIVLYDYNERNFTNNGLGTLADASSCIVNEELNGAYELEMKYPVDGLHYEELDLGKIIFAKPNQYSEKEPFRIYSISTPLDGDVTIKAQHISYDLSGYILPRFDSSLDKEAFATGPRSAFNRITSEANNIYQDFPFTFYTNSDEDHTDEDMAWEMTCESPSSIRSLLGDGDGHMLGLYTGEFLFNRFQVNFLVQRGEDRGAVIRYGKNLTSLSVIEDDSVMYSGIYPFWNGTVDTVDNSGQQIQVGKYVELNPPVIPISEDIPTKVYLLDLSNDYAKPPADEDMEEIAQKFVEDNGLGLPFSTLSVSYTQLSKSNEYMNFAMMERVELGDYVSVIYDKLLSGPQKVRCTKVSYNVLTDNIENIELGSARTLVNTISQQQSTLSNSTNYTREYVQEQLSNIPYDTALSTSSTNAVQNKVVTSKFNSVDKTCNSFKNEINNILSIVENLNPSGGAAISYGYSLPTGGNNGDAYVQITSTPKDPRAVVSECTVHNNFEVSNFTKSGTKYSFDISGTVDADQINYALVNVDNLRSGSEYKVTMRLSHDVPTASLDRSYYQYQGSHWTKAFGLFVGSKNNLKTEYVSDQASGRWFEQHCGLCEVRDRSNVIRSVKPSSCYQPQMQYQGFYKDVSDREYDFYFTASGTSASFGFVFDDCLDETVCNVSVVDMEVVYVGSPKIPVYWNDTGSIFANAMWNSNWEISYGISDWTNNGAWTNWGGGNGGVPEPFIGFTFNQATMMDRIRLNVWEGQEYDDPQGVLRTLYIEASTDDEAWNSENKEWINVLPGNTSVDIPYPWNHIDHVYFNINKGTYHDIRIRFVSPAENGKLEAIQCYLIEDQIPENHVKDLFFKIDGEWLVYPNDPEDEPVFTYGTEDPDENTEGDIYAKLTNDAIDSISYKVDGTWLLGPSGGGGSGGGGVTRETIWTGTATSSSTANTTTKPITDYDLLLCYHWDTYALATSDCEMHLFWVDPKHIANSNYATNQWDGNFEFTYYSTQYIRGKFTDSTTFYITQNNQGGCIARIDGIKFSGGGGGSERTDLLYSASGTTAPNTITLAHPYTDYEKLVVTAQTPVSGGNIGIASNTYYIDDFDTIEIIGGCSDIAYIWYTLTDATTLTKAAEAGGYYIKSIRGIGSSGQGTAIPT